jgi:membrane-associated phospholipid phosphatase
MFQPEVYAWGLSVIRALQSASNPLLVNVIKILTHIGSPAAAIVIILFVLWSVDEKKGFKLFFLIFVSFALNICLKNLLRVPRPFVFDPTVGLIPETGFSTPSGHAQGAAAFWTLFAWCCIKNRKKIRIALAVFLPFLVSFTRVYLGVHYPTDVFLGMTIGYLCALGGIFFYEGAAQKLLPLRRAYKLFALTLACLLANQFSGGDVTASGALFGFVLGYILKRGGGAHEESSAAGLTLRVRFLRFCAGSFLCVAVYGALKAPASLWHGASYEALIDFIRYAAVGFTASHLAPLCFEKFSKRGAA